MTVRLTCPVCARAAALGDRTCRACGGPLVFSYPLHTLDREVLLRTWRSRPSGVWRYRELLPIRRDTAIVSLGEGGTFLHRAKRLGERVGLTHLYLKDETTNPTGSFVDRGTTVALSHVAQLGVSSVASATTGNLGAAVAAYAAKAGLSCRLHVSLNVDLGKLFQMIAFGATVEPCHTYEEAIARTRVNGADAYVIHPADPYFLDGEKTTAYEIVEQLEWRPPERIIVPVGNGGHLAMIWRALCELRALRGGSRFRTRLTGAQLATSAPVVAAIAGEDAERNGHGTASLASEIAVPRPATGELAVQAIRESGGSAVAVTEQEVFAAMQWLARYEGIFAEPAAAATIAAVSRLCQEGEITSGESVVCVVTGSGLKDPSTASRLLPPGGPFARLRLSWQAIVRAQPLGATKIQLLRALSERDDYAYSLWKDLGKRLGVRMRVPTVYQHLGELMSMGLVIRTHAQRAGRGRPRQYYALTQRGKELTASLVALRT